MSRIFRATASTIVLALGLVTAAPGAGAAQHAPPDYLVTVRSSYDFQETVNRLKQAMEAENLMVIHEINPQQMLRMVGVRTGGMRQILFFHPRYMKRIFETNRNAGIEPPLKVLVMEAPNGNVMVRYEDPVRQFVDYQGLDPLALELRELVERITASVSR